MFRFDLGWGRALLLLAATATAPVTVTVVTVVTVMPWKERGIDQLWR